MFKITAAEKFPRFLFWNERGSSELSYRFDLCNVESIISYPTDHIRVDRSYPTPIEHKA